MFAPRRSRKCLHRKPSVRRVCTHRARRRRRCHPVNGARKHKIKLLFSLYYFFFLLIRICELSYNLQCTFARICLIAMSTFPNYIFALFIKKKVHCTRWCGGGGARARTKLYNWQNMYLRIRARIIICKF